MATSSTSLMSCPTCGSDDRERTEIEHVPGGTDWRYFACQDCGYEWRV